MVSRKKKCKKCLKYSPRGRKNAKHFLELVVGKALQPRSQLLVTTKVIKCATNKQTNKQIHRVSFLWKKILIFLQFYSSEDTFCDYKLITNTGRRCLEGMVINNGTRGT